MKRPGKTVANDLRHITRNGRTWAVRIWDSRIRDYHSANFNDSDYGPVAPETSLREAQAWRDEMISKHGIQSTFDRNGAYASHKNNRSGVVGVGLARSRSGKPQAWVAARGRDQVRFSIMRLGYEQAFQCAVEARYKMMGLPTPTPFPEAPDPKDA